MVRQGAAGVPAAESLPLDEARRVQAAAAWLCAGSCSAAIAPIASVKAAVIVTIFNR